MVRIRAVKLFEAAKDKGGYKGRPVTRDHDKVIQLKREGKGRLR
jgi:hypothetical protein